MQTSQKISVAKWVLIGSIYGFFAVAASAQQPSVPVSPTPSVGSHSVGSQSATVSAPVAQFASISGTVMDVDEYDIPGATITVDGPDASDHRVVTTSESGVFQLDSLRVGVSYQLTVSAKNFTAWKSPSITLTAGETDDLGEIKLNSFVEISVNAVTPEQAMIEQVQMEETQRILGFIPNFYVVYDPSPQPLTAKMKYQLALKTSTDVVTFSAAAFVAGIYQAADRHDFVQGAKGYGQRLGSEYTDGVSGILIGGAVLPSLLHQDPRYFYQGTGTKKSRALHAISAPFICHGDNGRLQFNYSSIGGDLASGALSNLYYPQSERGPGLVFNSTLVATGGRIMNALAQEFILSKFTTHAAH
jgi:hypothetical protein